MTCMSLDAASFKLLLGPLGALMKRRASEYDKPMSLQRTKSAESGFINVELEDLKPLGTLGEGSFGLVQLVKDEASGKTYALKSVNKGQIVKNGQQTHIMSEKNVMLKLHSQFTIRLHATFNTKNTLYFLLEASLGGDLFYQLRNRVFFDEPTAKFYAGCVVLAFEYMHSKQIIYRYLKPENLLLDERGYLKVADFGFAKFISGRTWTLCGTPDYLAPEVVLGKGHGKGVYWWTLGILVYEMLASYPPFYDFDPMETYARIARGKVQYPADFSKSSIDLIAKLLQRKPAKRLGVTKGGVKAIKSHEWFKDFDWGALQNGTMEPPIKPKVSGAEDMSNFEEPSDDEHEDPEKNVPYHDDGSGWDVDF